MEGIEVLKVSALTDIGYGRVNNEDSYAIIPPHTYLIADGMGGYAAGEVASSIMVETAKRILSKSVTVDEETLINVIKEANNEILKRITDDPTLKNMGTTVTVINVSGDHGIWANVGDSRSYIICGNNIKQLTHDHSITAELIEKGDISSEEAKSHPQRHMLTRAVGVEKDIIIDTGEFVFNLGDKLLLCSDGVTNVLSDEEIIKIINMLNSDSKAGEIVKHALSKGSRDNITAIVIENN